MCIKKVQATKSVAEIATFVLSQYISIESFLEQSQITTVRHRHRSSYFSIYNMSTLTRVNKEMIIIASHGSFTSNVK